MIYALTKRWGVRWISASVAGPAARVMLRAALSISSGGVSSVGGVVCAGPMNGYGACALSSTGVRGSTYEGVKDLLKGPGAIGVRLPMSR